MEVLARFAERWRVKRDIRDARSGSFSPGDRSGTGPGPQHSAEVPEVAGVDADKPRPLRGSKLDPYAEHIDRRMKEGLENCVVLLRELRALRYVGSYNTVVEYVKPRRKGSQPEATMRFETASGEQAQVDWGSLGYVGADGKKHRVWVFVMTMGWSRACYVELVRKADTAAFIQCHVNAFEYLGGVPRRCLYDNAKVVTLGKDQDGQAEWNLRMLDFARRVDL